MEYNHNAMSGQMQGAGPLYPLQRGLIHRITIEYNSVVRHDFQFVLALAALLCVLAVFVFPLTDLPGTALRSVQNARLLALRLAAAASLPALSAPALATYAWVLSDRIPFHSGPELLALTCARLC